MALVVVPSSAYSAMACGIEPGCTSMNKGNGSRKATAPSTSTRWRPMRLASFRISGRHSSPTAYWVKTKNSIALFCSFRVCCTMKITSALNTLPPSQISSTPTSSRASSLFWRRPRRACSSDCRPVSTKWPCGVLRKAITAPSGNSTVTVTTKTKAISRNVGLALPITPTSTTSGSSVASTVPSMPPPSRRPLMRVRCA